jgi:2-polyprenyl-6-methoxyphenol hydroxylase-like FAD-dependent oxidoreductase
VRLATRPPADLSAEALGAKVDARLAVSLPPSCRKLFDAIGVSDAIERAPFIRSTGNTVWWGSREPRVETFAAGARGWQVETDILEAVMLAEAARAGVAVERGSSAFALRASTFARSATADKSADKRDCSNPTAPAAPSVRNLRRSMAARYHGG